MPGIVIPTAKNKKKLLLFRNFWAYRKNTPAWRKNLGFYSKTKHIKIRFVSIADKICSQTQKNVKFWVWRVLISNIEKI